MPASLSLCTKCVFERLGILDPSFHTLRHRAGSWMVMEGASLDAVGQILGYKPPRMTQRYAHPSPDCMAASMGTLEGVMMREVLPANVSGEPEIVTTESPANGSDLAPVSNLLM